MFLKTWNGKRDGKDGEEMRSRDEISRLWSQSLAFSFTSLDSSSPSHCRLRHRCIHQPAVEDNIVKVEIKASFEKPKLQVTEWLTGEPDMTRGLWQHPNCLLMLKNAQRNMRCALHIINHTDHDVHALTRQCDVVSRVHVQQGSARSITSEIIYSA